MAATSLFAATALMCLPACITERTTTRRTPTTRERAGSSPRTALTTRVDPSRSASSAAKVALQPLGYVPYDGLVLPLISPDGKYLATQVGEAPEWEELLGQPGSTYGVNCSILIYELDKLTTNIDTGSENREGMVLGWFALEDGFQLLCPYCATPDHEVLRYGTWERIHSWHSPEQVFALHAFQSRGDDESPERVYRVRSSASRPPSGFDPTMRDVWLAFDMNGACMALATDEWRLRLIPGSIAGCWADTRFGPAVLLTTNDGLFLQRLTRDASGWRAEAPARLLREPYVPRATSNPDRPFILIGPGPKDRPERLHIVAMKLIEE